MGDAVLGSGAEQPIRPHEQVNSYIFLLVEKQRKLIVRMETDFFNILQVLTIEKRNLPHKLVLKKEISLLKISTNSLIAKLLLQPSLVNDEISSPELVNLCVTWPGHLNYQRKKHNHFFDFFFILSKPFPFILHSLIKYLIFFGC